MNTIPPRWDVSNIYPGLDSAEYENAVKDLSNQIDDLEALFNQQIKGSDAQTPTAELGELLSTAVNQLNQAFELSGTIRPYIFSFVTTDSRNTLARRRLSEFEKVGLRLRNLMTRFQSWVGTLAPVLDEVLRTNQIVLSHAFILKEAAEQSRYLMSEKEEDLAAELSMSGASAWGRLQGTITSQLAGEIELEGQVQKLPLPAIINLHSHMDEDIRRRAYELELELLNSVREPLAACMNGVKGTVNSLNQHRGRADALHSALDDARIDRSTLDAMMGAMQAAFPAFRKYFESKARLLNKGQLCWWDLFAPVGNSAQTYSFEDAQDFILSNFASFSTDLESLARRAFEHHWIDAEQRDGKRGGAFCMGVAGVKESRVLCNFDGTLDQVSTIAHELGHAFHNQCAFEAGKTELQQETPMTMAETASILCETLIMQAILKQTQDQQAELAILDTMLVSDSQVIVDISSRFIFEKEVFERRQKSELSADDFCEIMEIAQKATYGDGVNEAYLNKYMWAWKPHYYRESLSFYNFPYAFGLLFGIGLYAIYQQRGEAFIQDYENLLASTGEATAADLAARFGIDIHQQKFWEDSLNVIKMRIDRFCELADNHDFNKMR